MKKIKKLLCALAMATIICGLGLKNASAHDAELKAFSIKTEELYQEEKIYYEADYTGDVSFIAIWAKETTTGEQFYISTQYLDDGFFDLTKGGNTHNGTGTFELTGVVLGLRQSGTVFYATNRCDGRESEDCVKFDLSGNLFTIKEKQEEVDDLPVYDYVMTIDEQQVYKGDKVMVHFGAIGSVNEKEVNPKPLSSVMLSFINQTTYEILNVYLHSLDSEPYFIVPSTASIGTYMINYGYLTFTDGSSERYQNREGKVFSYESKFVVKEKELDKGNYVFNNEHYGQTVKSDLEKLNNDAIITVNASNLPIINRELFEAIQSTNRTLIIDYQNVRWVFNGKDIVNPKPIEASVKLEEFVASNTSGLKDIITTKSALLEFINNGELPGKALIRVNSKEVEEYFDSEVIYVYYYDEANDNILRVAMEVQKNDGFFEFYINHDSKYILTPNEITSKSDIGDDSVLKENTGEEGNSSEKNSNVVIYIIAGICALIVVVVAIVLVMRRKSKKAVENNMADGTAENQQESSGNPSSNSEPTPPAPTIS